MVYYYDWRQLKICRKFCAWGFRKWHMGIVSTDNKNLTSRGMVFFFFFRIMALMNVGRLFRIDGVQKLNKGTLKR